MPSSPSSPAAASPASACRWTPQTAAAEGVVPLREQPADHAGQDVAATGRPQARRPRGVPVDSPASDVPSRSGDDQRFWPLQEQGRPPFSGEPRRDPLAVRLDRVDRDSRQGRHLAGVRGEDSRGRSPHSTPGCHGRQGEQRLRIDDQGQRHLLDEATGQPIRVLVVSHAGADHGGVARSVLLLQHRQRGERQGSRRRLGERQDHQLGHDDADQGRDARRRGDADRPAADPQGRAGRQDRGAGESRGAGDDQELAAIGLARVVAMLQERQGLEQLGRDDPGR